MMRRMLIAFVLLLAASVRGQNAYLRPQPNSGPFSWTNGPYEYDGAGNITTIGPESYVYDKVGRLKTATVRGPDLTSLQTQSFDYDIYGNLTGTSKLGQTISLPTSTGTNRLETLHYDGAGHVDEVGTQHYAYDGVGMLNTMYFGGSKQPGVVYAYTADDERLLAFDVSTGMTHWTVRGMDNNVLRDFKQQGSTWSVDRDYVYRDGLLLAALKSGGGVEHYSLDHLGTPRLITDAAGHRIGNHAYWPYGEEWSPGNAQEGCPLKFTGHERDDDLSGGNAPLDYMHARYYGAGWGRFSAVDPALDLKKASSNPQMWNRYVYVVDNPLRFSDPNGREHVQEPGFTKPLSQANWSDAPPVIKASFYAEGGLLAAGAANEGATSFGPALQYAALAFSVRFPTLWNMAQSYLEGETGTPSIGGFRAVPSAVAKAEKTAGTLGMTGDQLVKDVVKNGARFIDQSHGTVNILMRRPDGGAGFVRVTVDATGKVLSVGLNQARDVRNGLVKGRLLPY